eukprot:11468391-Ditylum_brightwellii.AAC.1
MVLFKQISGLHNRHNTASFQIGLDNQIATVLNKAPAKYSTVLTCEQQNQGGNLTMGHLQEAMIQLYRTSHGSSNASNSTPEV